MTDHEPIPIERTQKIEIALKTYETGSPNLVQIHDLDHQVAKIESELGEEPDVCVSLKEIKNYRRKLREMPASPARSQKHGRRSAP